MPPAAGGRLTTGPIPKHVRALAVPMIGGIFAVISKSIVDTYFVAQLGTEALSAMGFMFPVMMVIANLAIGLGAGTSSVVARCIGQGDPGLVRRRATDGLFLAIVLVSTTALVGLLTMDPLFRALGAKGLVLEHVQAYMHTWYWGMGFLVVPMVGNGIIRATGDAKVPGMIMVASAVVNAGLDPVLIFGLFGLPALGIQGAALATVISNIITFVAALGVLTFREKLIDLKPPSLVEVVASWKEILRIGLPASLTNMINPVGATVVTAILARFGAEVVAGYGVATRIEALAVVVMLALSASVGPIVGQNAGAGQMDRVRQTLRYAYSASAVWGLLVAVLLFFTGGAIAAGFDDTAEVVQVAGAYLAYVPITLVGYGFGIITAATFNALGRPLGATVLTVVRVIFVFVPVTWWTAQYVDWRGVIVGAALANILVGGAAWSLARRTLGGVRP